MKYFILSFALLASSYAFAHTPVPGESAAGIVMKNGEHSCSSYRAAIQQYGKIVVSYGWASVAFNSSPHSCHFSRRPVARHINATDGSCLLRWTCVTVTPRGER